MAIGKLDLVVSVKWGVSFENVLKDLKCGCIGVRWWLVLDLTFGCVVAGSAIWYFAFDIMACYVLLMCLDLRRLLDGWCVFCVGAVWG